MKTFVSIQHLRAAAALAVVTYHAFQWRNGGFEVGRAGVDVFFVISGFIMWTVTDGHAVTAAGFLWRRFTRVAPLYWLATLFVAAMALVWPLFLPQVRVSWAHLALSMAFIPHNDLGGLPFPLLPSGWTLNYEAVFYVIFAAALLAPAAWRLAIVVMSLLTIALFGLFDPPTYELGANPMLLQFAAGAVIGKLAVERMLPTRAWAGVLLFAGVAAFTVMEVYGLRSDLWRPFLWGFPALAIVTGAVSLEARGPVPAWPPLKTLGDASYAIYLCHLPATALVAHTLGTGSVWLFLPASIIVSIAAGLACRHGLEKPLLAALRSVGPRAAARAASAGAV